MKLFFFPICQIVKSIPPADVVFNEKIHLVKSLHVCLHYYLQDLKLLEIKTSVSSYSPV